MALPQEQVSWVVLALNLAETMSEASSCFYTPLNALRAVQHTSMMHWQLPAGVGLGSAGHGHHHDSQSGSQMGSGQADRAAGFRSSGVPGLLLPEDCRSLDLDQHSSLIAVSPPSASLPCPHHRRFKQSCACQSCASRIDHGACLSVLDPMVCNSMFAGLPGWQPHPT